MTMMRPGNWTRVAAAGACLAALSAVTGTATASDGRLVYKGCVSADRSVHCGPKIRQSLYRAESTATSQDGRSVYAAADGGITAFKRHRSGHLVYQGCLSARESVDCAGPTFRSLGGSYDVAVSPNGRSVYIAADGAVTRLIRHPTGRLSFGGCVAETASFGCDATAPWLGYEVGVGVSPDNRSVYVVGSSPIAWFKPTPGGGLALGGCIRDRTRGGCEKSDHSILRDRWSVAVSPDGKTVYVTSDSRVAGGVTWFKRRPNGSLTGGDCITVYGTEKCREAPHKTLFRSEGIAVSPTGKSVYIAASPGLTRFRRAENGRLEYAGCLAGMPSGPEGCPGPVHSSLDGARDVALGDSGRSIYVDSADTEDAVSYLRPKAGGGIAFVDCVEQQGRIGCARATHPSLGYMGGLSASRDGSSVYVSAYSRGALTWLKARR